LSRLQAIRALLVALLLMSAAVAVAIVIVAPADTPGSAPVRSTAPAAAATAGHTPARAAPARALPPGYTPPRPLLWKVSDADNDVYLLGSFHALKPSDYPVGPGVDAAFADAELVVFEISPAEMASSQLSQDMMMAAMRDDGSSLQDSLDPALWQRLQSYCSSRGLPVETFQMLEPWFVSLMISISEMGRVGFDPQQGLDQQLIARATREHKRTAGLETAASQIAVLDGMSATEQQQSLSEALDDSEQAETRMNELHDLWRRGDDSGLEALLAGDFKRQYAQLYQRLNVDRNQAWVPQVRRMLDESHSDDALVVVGSMHLLGPDGLVSQLKARGYQVQRL
jgi:uncharacterized protein YbaP (TraB family)